MTRVLPGAVLVGFGLIFLAPILRSLRRQGSSMQLERGELRRATALAGGAFVLLGMAHIFDQTWIAGLAMLLGAAYIAWLIVLSVAMVLTPKWASSVLGSVGTANARGQSVQSTRELEHETRRGGLIVVGTWLVLGLATWLALRGQAFNAVPFAILLGVAWIALIVVLVRRRKITDSRHNVGGVGQ